MRKMGRDSEIQNRMTQRKIDTDTLASGPELAVVLGIEPRRVQSLAKEGVLERVSRGRYLLAESVRRYIGFKSRVASPAEWRQARTENLRVRTERERVALELDRLRAQMTESHKRLDGKFWELLVTRMEVGNDICTEAFEAGILVSGREYVLANIATNRIAFARKRVIDGLQAYRASLPVTDEQHAAVAAAEKRNGNGLDSEAQAN